ncbi:MAG: cobalamin-binding protein [Candidatus Acidiferrales bacterium]
MRICSFLPSATETLYALGLGDSVVGVTYECDFPAEVKSKPVVVHTKLPRSSSPGEIDRLVREFVARGESLYRVDIELLAQLQPDLIVTQDLCHVCAASPDDLSSALSALPGSPRVLSLSPRTVGDLWSDIVLLGEAADRVQEARELVSELQRRVTAVRKAVADAPRPRVVCLEWLDPPFVAGHWAPEMVDFAGGRDVLGRAGSPSFRVDWQDVVRSEADTVVLMPCGYDLEQTMTEFAGLALPNGWGDLPAVRRGQVFAVDAAGYCSRPGPRVATGIEMLASVLHPDRASFPRPARSVEKAVRSPQPEAGGRKAAPNRTAPSDF